jgi:hypothetical protein
MSYCLDSAAQSVGEQFGGNVCLFLRAEVPHTENETVREIGREHLPLAAVVSVAHGYQ